MVVNWLTAQLFIFDNMQEEFFYWDLLSSRPKSSATSYNICQWILFLISVSSGHPLCDWFTCNKQASNAARDTKKLCKNAFLKSNVVQLFSYMSLRSFSWPSWVGGSQAWSLTFHSLICWSQERRLYFLNLLGVFGWMPGWRRCLCTVQRHIISHICCKKLQKNFIFGQLKLASN